MDKKKRKRLEEAGWKFGSAEEFLGLSPEEAAIVELRLRLSDALKKRRASLGWSQQKLAQTISSSQSRVAKMEGDDPSVSIDLLIRGLLSTGIGLDALSKIIKSKNLKPEPVR